jgi:hypothetical protein
MGAAGCGNGEPQFKEEPVPTECQKRLRIIGDTYVRATQKLNRPPNNLSEFMPTLKDYVKAQPSAGKADEILKSPNDGQLFEIVWGVMLLQLKDRGSDVPIVAFERVGANGERNVLRGSRETLLMSERELRSGKFPDGYKPPF